MSRLLIFVLLFPAVATASFYVLLDILTGAELDSLSGPAWLYLAFIGPALLIAGVDSIAARLSVMPAVLVTTLFGYTAATLAAVGALQNGLSPQALALGLIGAVPAGLCSWMSRHRNGATRVETQS
ncbi:hypothetical protein BH11PSE4_BH11PSE4_06630 [soil metagenome]